MSLLDFFARMRGDFKASPQKYHKTWRKKTGAKKKFLGPWNYTGSLKANQRGGYKSPVNKVSTTKKRIFKFGQNHSDALGDE